MQDRFHILVARKIAGSISSVEVMELETLLNGNPDLRLPFELLEQMIAQEQEQKVSPEAKEAFVRHWLKFNEELKLPIVISEEAIDVKPPRKQISKSKLYRLFFAAAFLVVSVLFIWKAFHGSIFKDLHPDQQLITISTPAGVNREVILPDGSKIWLNASSVLRYDSVAFGKGNREVDFDGEGFFDVTHDPSKPFLVHSGNMQIRVLGTAFNIKAYPEENEIETSLIRGSVEVRLQDRPNDVYILRPHEKLVVSKLSETVQDKISSADRPLSSLKIPWVSLSKINISDSGKLVEETAWMQKKLVFRSEPFSSLAFKMERHYGVNVHFENLESRDIEFTGIFTTETIEQALEAMQMVHHFSFTIDKENIYIR
jgi:transmembrane sensor